MAASAARRNFRIRQRIDLLLHRYARTGDPDVGNIVADPRWRRWRAAASTTSLPADFHRYSVDEHWIVPHFEKMSYDNSELLKNYVHAYQATGVPFFAAVARTSSAGWTNGSATASTAASMDRRTPTISMDDDGDYFTWTLDEAREVLTPTN